MKLLFISHPIRYRQKPDFPPIGIAYLAAVVRAKGHEVRLIDGALNNISQIVTEAKEFSPYFIGVTCWTIGRQMVWRLCSLLKKFLPDTFLAVGGPHASYLSEHIFAKTPANAVIIGEGEETTCAIIDAIENNRDLSRVKGLVFRQQDGIIVHTEQQPHVAQLDAIPFPYYMGFKNFSFHQYAGLAVLPKPTAPIITSRGCLFDCSFCGSVNFWGRKWRPRSAKNVLSELRWLVNIMGARSIYFFDDNFPAMKKRAMEICQGIIDFQLNIEWACCSHVKMIDKELLDAMRKSRCTCIDFGVESGSNDILRRINKHQTRDDIEKTFELTHNAGIKPRAFLMVGNPGETKRTIDETIDMIEKIKPHASIGASILWLLPGTNVYKKAKKNGFIDDNYWLKDDDVPYNLQEHTQDELFKLRQRLMWGIVRKKTSISSLLSFLLKNLYYRYPFLSLIRSLVPDKLK